MSAATDTQDPAWLSFHTDFMKRLAPLIEKDDGEQTTSLSRTYPEHDICYRFERTPDSIKLAVEMGEGSSRLKIWRAPEEPIGVFCDITELDEKYRQMAHSLTV